MASIVKRKKKYSVVYYYTDEAGNKRQKWETFETHTEALCLDFHRPLQVPTRL